MLFVCLFASLLRRSSLVESFNPTSANTSF